METEKCYYCKYWGRNCGKECNSTFTSQCQKKKKHTVANQICKHFEADKKVVDRIIDK